MVEIIISNPPSAAVPSSSFTSSGSALATADSLFPGTPRYWDASSGRGFTDGGVASDTAVLTFDTSLNQVVGADGALSVDATDADGLAVRADTGGLIGDFAGMGLQGGFPGQGMLQHRPYMMCKFKIPVIAGTGHVVYVCCILVNPQNGASDEPPIGSEGIYLRYRPGHVTFGNRFALGSKVAGLPATYVDTGFTVVPTNLHVAEIHHDGTNLIARINGGSLITHPGPFPALNVPLINANIVPFIRIVGLNAAVKSIIYYRGRYEQR